MCEVHGGQRMVVPSYKYMFVKLQSKFLFLNFIYILLQKYMYLVICLLAFAQSVNEEFTYSC